MESSVETSQTGGISKPKPALGPKPRLAPKPFSLQKNTSIRSIRAPRTSATSAAAGAPGVRPALLTSAQQPATSDSKPSSVSELAKEQPKTTKESKAVPHGEDTLDSGVGKSDPAPETAPPKETPESEPIQKDDVVQTNHKASTDTNSEQRDGKKEEDETSVVQKLEESGGNISSTASPAYQRGSVRKRLPTELTSMFQSGGPPPLPQPTITVSTTSTKDDANKPESSDPEQTQATSEPSSRAGDEGGLKEDYDGGCSIKRRISLLFDSSSRPEVKTRREEPEILNGAGGVKARIKNWTAETSSERPKTERRPQVVPRSHSKSSEPETAATAEKTPKMQPVEPPATATSSSQAVDPPPKVSPAEQPTETPMETSRHALTEDKSAESPREVSGEHQENKSADGDAQLRSRSPSPSQPATDEGDAVSESAQHAMKRDSVKRRSVRFGVVERDDGGPPVILGSEPESSEEEEEEEEENASADEAEEDVPVSVPVYRRIGIAQKKDEEVQEQEAERLKHLEFERKRRAEENEQWRLKLEEERKRKEEEEEREKEKARQREEEEERERERLKVEEMEREMKEERERERLKEEMMERERQMELMRQREEERERVMQREERHKQDQEEREKERLKEEERKEERLREERERQRLREEEEERSIHEHEEHRLEGKLREEEMNKEKEREEEWEKEWVKKTARLGGGEEEEEEEREREKEERLKQDQEEREKERLKEEERKEERLREERERQRLREEEERSIHEHEEHRLEGKLREEEMNKEKEREEEWEKEWVKETARVGGGEEEEEEREREKEERLKQEEREKERLREEAEERERQRRLKEQQEKEEEMERMRQIEAERQREEERREEERKRQIEKESVEELERKKREELEKKRAQELEEQLRAEEEKGRDGRGESAVDEPNLISFDSEDAPQKSQSPYSPIAKACKPTESEMDMVYDDFSVRRPLQVDFDDFSVKTKRWGSQPKVETSPLIHVWAPDPVDKEEAEELVPLDVSPQESKVPEQVEKPDSPEPTLAQERPEREEEGETKEDEVEEAEEEEDKKEAQVYSYCVDGEDKDTDALIDLQNEACEQTPETADSPTPVPDQVPENLDTTDSHTLAELFPFPESSAPLLDTSAQRSKADLGKRRNRTRPSRSFHGVLDQRDWRTCDSTEGKEAPSKQRDSDSEEEQPKPKLVCSPPPASQRVPVFPGLSPAALLAQLKRRTGGGGPGGEEAEEDKGTGERESQKEEAAPSPSQLPRSPRPASQLAGAARVLPPLGGTDGGAVSSPAWLKELKSKKRLSQYDGEA